MPRLFFPFKVKKQMASRIVNPFTTIQDRNFRRHSSMHVTIHDGTFRRVYYSYTRISGSWNALRPGSEEENFYNVTMIMIIQSSCLREQRTHKLDFRVQNNLFLLRYFMLKRLCPLSHDSILCGTSVIER